MEVIMERIDQISLSGQSLADRVASFGGSWTSILGVMVLWIAINSNVLIHWQKHSFDPYPYILLDLVLSMMAAIQTPIIMMSQNRQAAKDRADATHGYEVNLKVELGIMALHEKLDGLQEHQWEVLIMIQKKQICLWISLIEEPKGVKLATNVARA